MTTSATGALEHRDYAAVDDETKRAYEKFNLQRSAQKVAMSTVRDMHIAAGAENMVYREFPPGDFLCHDIYGYPRANTWGSPRQCQCHVQVHDSPINANDIAELPAELLDSMRTCHNAATEFLRQYWSAVLPTPVAALGAGTASTSESAKAAKAERMAGYLKGMEGKLEAVVHLGVSMGVDQGRVRAVRSLSYAQAVCLCSKGVERAYRRSTAECDQFELERAKGES